MKKRFWILLLVLLIVESQQQTVVFYPSTDSFAKKQTQASLAEEWNHQLEWDRVDQLLVGSTNQCSVILVNNVFSGEYRGINGSSGELLWNRRLSIQKETNLILLDLDNDNEDELFTITSNNTLISLNMLTGLIETSWNLPRDENNLILSYKYENQTYLLLENISNITLYNTNMTGGTLLWEMSRTDLFGNGTLFSNFIVQEVTGSPWLVYCSLVGSSVYINGLSLLSGEMRLMTCLEQELQDYIYQFAIMTVQPNIFSTKVDSTKVVSIISNTQVRYFSLELQTLMLISEPPQLEGNIRPNYVAAGNLDNNNDYELIISTRDMFTALKGATLVPMWEKKIQMTVHTYQTVSLADITDDGKLDVFVINYGGVKDLAKTQMTLLEGSNGQIIKTFELPNAFTSPKLFDFNSDGSFEIVLVDDENCMRMFDLGKTGKRLFWQSGQNQAYQTSSIELRDIDPDFDSLSTYSEKSYGTDPYNHDTDIDGLPDGWEVHWQLDPLEGGTNNEDCDDDSLSNALEYVHGTNPLSNDTDQDLLPDFWEVLHGTDPTRYDSYLDLDGDTLDAYTEFIHDTDPFKNDTDDDGMADGWEITHNFDPTSKRDQLHDVDEDGLTNVEEFLAGSNPRLNDSDGDLLSDLAEVQLHRTDPSNFDTDTDGMPDGWEVMVGLNPLDRSDALLDYDNDGLSNVEEYQLDLNATNPDTDGDGLTDGLEVLYNLDPTNPDSDGDGSPDGEEFGGLFLDPHDPFLSTTNRFVFLGLLILAVALFSVAGKVIVLPRFLNRKVKGRLRTIFEKRTTENYNSLVLSLGLLAEIESEPYWTSVDKNLHLLTLLTLAELELSLMAKDGVFQIYKIDRIGRKILILGEKVNSSEITCVGNWILAKLALADLNAELALSHYNHALQHSQDTQLKFDTKIKDQLDILKRQQYLDVPESLSTYKSKFLLELQSLVAYLVLTHLSIVGKVDVSLFQDLMELLTRIDKESMDELDMLTYLEDAKRILDEN